MFVATLLTASATVVGVAVGIALIGTFLCTLD
jgi:hypothetical protein